MENETSNNHETANGIKSDVSRSGLTDAEASELQLLRLLQADNRRWLSMAEFERIAELARKQFEGAGSPHCG